VARQEPLGPQVKVQLVLQACLVLTELQEPLDCAELLEALEFKVSKERLGNKVLLGLEHLEPQVLRVSKAQSGHKVQQEWSGLAELLD
jgi:hypothetical protein